jgi:hypothetical protein
MAASREFIYKGAGAEVMVGGQQFQGEVVIGALEKEGGSG